jgi:hypothetical protein
MILLNSPQRELGTSVRFEVVDDPQIPFTPKAGKNPLQDKLNVT